MLQFKSRCTTMDRIFKLSLSKGPPWRSFSVSFSTQWPSAVISPDRPNIPPVCNQVLLNICHSLLLVYGEFMFSEFSLTFYEKRVCFIWSRKPHPFNLSFISTVQQCITGICSHSRPLIFLSGLRSKLVSWFMHACHDRMHLIWQCLTLKVKYWWQLLNFSFVIDDTLPFFPAD